MSERILRCPRCGTESKASLGKCPSCGLAIALKRHARHRSRSMALGRSAPARGRGGGRLEASLERTGDVETTIDDFDGVSSTQRYELPVGQQQRPQNNSRQDEPKGGEVEVGTMANMLLDPSVDVTTMQKDAAAPAKSSTLGLAEQKYGTGTETKGALPGTEPSEGLTSDMIFEQLEELAPEKPANGIPPLITKQAHKEQKKHHLLTRVLPLGIALLVVIFAGRLFLPHPVSLDGEYTAVFSDDEGREVTCTTRFQDLGDGNVRGLFECKLYETLTSLDRIDEPHVLKPIMGDGRISYNGHFEKASIELRLGSLNPDDDRAVVMKAKITSGGVEINGSMVNSLGNKATAHIIRPEGD